MQNKIIRSSRKILIIILCFIQIVGITWARDEEVCGYNKCKSQILDKKVLEEFTDEFFTRYMNQYQIPGGAIIVVQDGEILLKKGYGYSNLETKEAFSADDTYFSIASITKTFTALAAMKLVEEGKIDLQEDILTYLPTLKINNPYKEKITVEHLLTHTSGIDTSYTEDLSYEQPDIEEPYHLLKLLNKRGIKVISKPGAFIEYSSYGTVVLGAIVEEVSGISCERYIKENILEPLDTKHTSILNPDTRLTKGYLCSQNTLTEAKLKGYFRLYPEGGLVSCVEDMGHYIKMLLSKGRYERQDILETSTVETMLQRQTGFDDLLPGMGYGFAEYKDEGTRSVGHAGYSIDGTLSEIIIYPEQNIGTFIVVNRGSNNNIQSDFRKEFITKFLDSDAEIKLNNMDQQVKNSKENKDKNQKQDNTTVFDVEGTYRFSDYSRSNIYKANTFGVGEVEVKKIDKDTISLSGSDEFTYEPYEKEAEAIGNLTYKIKDDGSYIVFKANEAGKVLYMAESESSSHGIYERMKWYDKAKYQVPFFCVSLVIYSVQLVVALIMFIKQKLKRNKNKEGRRIGRLINGIAFLNIGFFAYAMFLWGDRLRYDVPLDIYINLSMPIMSLVLTILLAIEIIRKIYCKEAVGKRKILKLIYEVFMLMLSGTFIVFLNYWNFIGYKL